ncbi:MAG: TonB-dependent receptor plug domain-containing protein, partial [Bacteroidetes bacterium]|nr:TonB-dependent receptor plug domain-containing protein [Bacteroidota bacterium]
MRKSLTLLAVLVLSSVLVFAQTKVLTGRITDDKGQPVPFATIKVKSTKSGVSADGDGNFTIKAKTGDLLEISGTGVSAKEVTVGESLRLNITLERRNAAMTEVVVTALGQTQSKARVGYSTQTFSSAVINRNASVGALDGLQGKIAGADISTTGGPGASTKVVLRSFGLIGTSNQPLYVIDGVPLSDGQFQHTSTGIDGADYGNGMNNINPNDIESITILKGTAASSLYGGLAKNGAIMITTKKGRAGKLRVEYSGGANWSTVGKLPEYQDQFGQGWGGVFVLSENGSWGPRMDGQNRKWGSIVDGDQLSKPFSPIKDPLRKFYTTGSEVTNSVSLSGGNDITRFYASYSNVTSDGVVP